MQAFVWLSFDLGIRGDLDGMYQFLGAHNAKECGGNTAGFNYEFRKDLVAELTKELTDSVKFDKRSRVYLIRPTQKRYGGRFIVGSRRVPPWASYLPSDDDEEDVSG